MSTDAIRRQLMEVLNRYPSRPAVWYTTTPVTTAVTIEVDWNDIMRSATDNVIPVVQRPNVRIRLPRQLSNDEQRALLAILATAVINLDMSSVVNERGDDGAGAVQGGMSNANNQHQGSETVAGVYEEQWWGSVAEVD